MGWTVEFLEEAARDLARLDKSAQKRIVGFVRERLQGSENPRRFGKTLQGNHMGRWRYRVGDYRLICNIEDDRLREVYR